MAGRKRTRSSPQSNSIRQRFMGLSGKERPTSPIPRSQTPPIPHSPASTTATATEVVGDQPISPQSPIILERAPEKHKVPNKLVRLFGAVILDPANPQSNTPTDTSATSGIGSVPNQPIQAAPTVQDTTNPRQPQRAQEPIAGSVRPRRYGSALDPNSVGVTFCTRKELWESNVWYPGAGIQGNSTSGLQLFLGLHRTKLEAQDVHDRAALKLFEAAGVAPSLNFPDSCHLEFMHKYRDWDLRDFLWQLRRGSARFSRGRSSMKGVVVRESAKNGNLFEAKIMVGYTHSGKKVMYSTEKRKSEEEAGKAYDRALMFLHRNDTEAEKLSVITNFRPSTYSETEIRQAGEAMGMVCKDIDLGL